MIINRIAVLNYRCLRYVDLPLERFHLLVGPNASGKSTLLDALHFLKDLMSVKEVGEACEMRSENFLDLVWQRDKNNPWFEILVEFSIPKSLRQNVSEKNGFHVFQYAVKIGLNKKGETCILYERGCLAIEEEMDPHALQRNLFPNPPNPPETLIKKNQRKRKIRSIISKSDQGKDHIYSEVAGRAGRPVGERGWALALTLGPKRSTLAYLPIDRDKSPVTNSVAELLRENIHTVQLDSTILRQASPSAWRADFATNGASLPWAVRKFFKESESEFYKWIDHLREALPDLESIDVKEREDDRHCYLCLKYKNGLIVPSWMASDGTLRLIALTLLAYWPGQDAGFFLIEEPENGIHPKATQTVFDSLSSVYDHQVMLATHSPVILSQAEVKDVLCFAKDKDGATDIVRGTDHPRLREWKAGSLNLGEFFAAGILG